MSDVFVSYKRENLAAVRRLVEALRAEGIRVWWDKDILPNAAWEATIERQLAIAKLVIVAWSPAAVASDNVKAEARWARTQGRLLQVFVEPCEPPLFFGERQGIDLDHWSGGASDTAFQSVLGSVRHALQSAPTSLSDANPLPDSIADLAAEARTAPLPATPGPAKRHGGATARWEAIENSLDADDYADFLDVFPQAEEAFDARRKRRRLEAWANTNKTDAVAVAAFLRSGSFPALQEVVQAAADNLAAATERSKFLAVPARARVSEARDAAINERALLARSFSIDLPGAAGWPRPVMVAIPPGRFMMGSSDDEARWVGYDDEEEPRHEVKIDHVVALGRGAVTVDAFSTFIAETHHDMGDSASILKNEKWEDTPGRGWRDPGFAQEADHPVTCVSWHDALAFVAWLNDRLELADQPDAYRLPSEAEWEYACRAGTMTPFSFGATITTDQANFNDTAGYGGREPSMVWRRATTPVGQFSANAFGLYDMHGDIWNWCEDPWNATYKGVPGDGSAPVTGDASLRVLRGGSWNSTPLYCRSAMRFRYDPFARSYVFGFRLARTLSPPDA